jgi:hypothetical protein
MGAGRMLLPNYRGRRGGQWRDHRPVISAASVKATVVQESGLTDSVSLRKHLRTPG